MTVTTPLAHGGARLRLGTGTAALLTSATGGKSWPVDALMVFFGLLGAVVALLALETRGVDLEAKAGRTPRDTPTRGSRRGADATVSYLGE